MRATPFRVLLVGESWFSLGTHVKGFNNFSTGYYEVGLEPLARAMDGYAQLTHLPSHLAATQFPNTVDALQTYDVILFSDVGSDTLLLDPDTFLRTQPKPNRLRLLQEYVRRGGGFAMFGGYMSFGGFGGQAHYHKTSIEEILPVEISPFDDRVETPEGISPTMTSVNHAILEGVDPPWPAILGYNRFAAKPGSKVLLEHERDPILVVGTFGEGRTGAYASDVSPHWGSTEFVNWVHYERFWQQFVSWLGGA